MLVLSVQPAAQPVSAVPGAYAEPHVSAGPANPADIYRYLENPRMTGEGQQRPHASLRPYGDAATAVADVTEHAAPSPWVASLNGAWRLKVVNRPEDVPAGFHRAGYDVSRWPVAQVPHTWQSDFLDHPMFRNIPEELWPDDPPKVPRDVNPTGAYVRTMQVPSAWDGRSTFLRFEGVTSGYFVWVNGQYVGYDQGGYTPAEFDVTAALRPGENTVAVQVHRWGSGSYLEDFDQWRYSGIFRDVWLYSTPRTRLADLHVTTDLDSANRDATFSARVELAGVPGTYTVRGTLRDPAGRDTAVLSAPVTITGSTAATTLTRTISAPAKWSAEEPTLYTLLLELLDPAGQVSHVTSQAVGFREVAVRSKQVQVNGGRILVRGVNRAETDPDTGRHVSREAQRTDVMLMKRLHVNGVRTSHYPSDPHFYDLADKHGLWLADEVDIETHAHENCPSDCLASRPEWQDAFADRFRAMVARDRNHPSVIFWDTGNEAGLGTAHQAMADWATANEPTRLLYHQSNKPSGDAPFAHVNGLRYPTPAELEAKAKSTAKPIVMGEYEHAMGNSLGNFDQFWALARKYPQVQGGFVWDWAEQNLRQPLITTPDSSPNGIQAFLVGKPGEAAGRRGKAAALSGLDDYVDVFRDRRLDVSGTTKLSVDAWVKPGSWGGSFPIVTKGLQWALQMRDAKTLEFGVDAGSWQAVAAAVPANWANTWHRVTGVYDGANLRLYIDGTEVAAAARTGKLRPTVYEVNVGRNAETQQDKTKTRLGHGLVDDVRVYKSVLTRAELAAGADPSARAALALDFDTFTNEGDFLSLGMSLSGTDGVIGSDRALQPKAVELASVHAPVRFRAVDAVAGTVAVTNEQQAGALDLRLAWELVEVDRPLKSGSTDLRLAPGQTVTVDLPSEQANPADVERWLNLTALTTKATPWADAGSVFTTQQFAAGGRQVPGIALPPGTADPARVTRGTNTVTVAGTAWTYTFDTVTGTLTSMNAAGTELLRGGPTLDVYRPPTSNESYTWGTEDRKLWRDVGLDRLRTTVTSATADPAPDGGAVVEIKSTVAAGDVAGAFTVDQTMRFRIDRRGTITLSHRAQARGSKVSTLPYLPRVGFAVKMPDTMNRFAWYGRGKEESYNDRKDGLPVGVWSSTVDEQYVDYARPQAYGNHTDTRWATLSDGQRAGLLVAGDLDVSVTPYDDLARAEYAFQLPLVRNRGWVTLHVEHGETGVGETPNSVLDPYKLSPTKAYAYDVTIRPLTPAEVRAGGRATGG